LHGDTEVNASEIAVRLDVIGVDIATQDKELCAAVLQSKEWAMGRLSPQDVVAITLLARACEFDLDEGTTPSGDGDAGDRSRSGLGSTAQRPH
jgi:hypothetical protein